MRYFFALTALVFIAGCSAESRKDPLFQFQAPAITDQEFTDGLPVPDEEYGKEISYEAQIKSGGGTYIPKNTARTKSK